MKQPLHNITFREALGVWLRVALNSFGGPAGQIAVMHKVLVEEKKWISENRFLHALNYCMLLPGPEAQQLATYMGWLLHGTRGGLVSGLLFIAPGFLALLVLSLIYALFQETTFIEALFFGVKAAVLALVLEAVQRVSKRALKNPVMYLIAAVAFIAIFFFNVPFPFIVIIAGLVGFIGGQLAPNVFQVIKGQGDKDVSDEGFVITDEIASQIKPSLKATLQTTFVWLAIWLLPFAFLWIALGREHVFVRLAQFFSQAALVTFGGAYAVLAYVAQQAVDVFGWLEPKEVVIGLSMAETTPGPLIMVNQFVGFMGAYRFAGDLNPVLSGIIGSVITVWATFAPCFLFIFVGAPFIESLRQNKALSTTLSAITAAVVGVILNLAIWFALHVIFTTVNESQWGLLHLSLPDWSSLNILALVLSALAFLFTFRWHWGMFKTLGLCTLLGFIYYFLR
ncbi:MAG: chromate efflux transporter [Trueperaceae bacterium]